jgi:hypothetical protein
MRTFDSCLNNQSKAFKFVWIVIQYHNCCQLAWTNTVIIELHVHPIIDSTARLVGGMTSEGINVTDVFSCKFDINAKVVRQKVDTQSRRQPQEIKVFTAVPFHVALPRGSASSSKHARHGCKRGLARRLQYNRFGVDGVVHVVAGAKVIMMYDVTPNTSVNHINNEGVCKSLSRLKFIHATSMTFLSTTPGSFGGMNQK